MSGLCNPGFEDQAPQTFHILSDHRSREQFLCFFDTSEDGVLLKSNFNGLGPCFAKAGTVENILPPTIAFIVRLAVSQLG